MWHKLHDFNLTCPVHTSSIGPELMRMRQLSRSLMLQGVKSAPEIKIEDTWELLSGQRLALLTSGMARYDAMVHCYLAHTMMVVSMDEHDAKGSDDVLEGPPLADDPTLRHSSLNMLCQTTTIYAVV